MWVKDWGAMGRAVRVLWLSSRGMVEDYQSVAALAMPHGRQQCGHIWQWRPSRVVFLQPGGVLSVGVMHRGQQQERQGLQCRQLWQVETVCCWHWATPCKQRHLWLDRQQCLRRVQPLCVAPQLGGQWLQHGGCQGLMDVGTVVDGADHCSLSCEVTTHSH